jgi:uroporphyrinogen decarboxylase
MPDYQDLIDLVRGPVPEKPLPAIWDFCPCHAGAVGGLPDLIRYYFDVDEKVRAQLRLKEVIPEALILPGVFPDLGVIVEVSAFGGQMLWFDNGAPYISPSLGELKEIDTLKTPKPGKAGLTPVVLTQREMMRQRLKERGLELERFAMSMGPAEISGLLLGYEKYYLGLHDDPKHLHALMEMVTGFVIEWVRLQDTTIGGADVLVIADHVCHQVRPEHLNEFIFPYINAAFSTFPEAIKIYHNEGFHSDEHIETVLRFGADIWHFGSDVHDLSDLYSRVGDKVVLFGGVDPHGVMRHGTPEEVRVETRAVKEAANGRRLLLSTGTGTTPDATLTNQRAMVEEALA